VFTGVVAIDVLRDLHDDVRPRERRSGAADALHDGSMRLLVRLIEGEAAGDVSALRTELLSCIARTRSLAA
jgi:hypothetical protein